MDDNQIIQLFWKRDENAIQEQCETEDEVYDDETYIEETYTEEDNYDYQEVLSLKKEM